MGVLLYDRNVLASPNVTLRLVILSCCVVWVAMALGVKAAIQQPSIVLSGSAAFHLLWQLTLTASLASAPAPTLPWSRATRALSCWEMDAAR